MSTGFPDQTPGTCLPDQILSTAFRVQTLITAFSGQTIVGTGFPDQTPDTCIPDQILSTAFHRQTMGTGFLGSSPSHPWTNPGLSPVDPYAISEPTLDHPRMIHDFFLSHLWTIPGSFLSYP